MGFRFSQSLLGKLRNATWRPYLVATATVVVITALKLQTSVAFGEADANLAYLAGVMIAGWLGGFGPAMMATVLSVLAADYFFMYPRYSFATTSFDQVIVQMGTFVEGTVIAVLCETMRRAKTRAATAAVEAVKRGMALREANEELQRLMVEQKKTEERLREVHKMEALGRLAGGVAHDFNNLLSVIGSFGEMLLEDVDPAHGDDVMEILNAGKRASALTQQLLAFSRRQVINARPVNLSASLLDMKVMLARLIGPSVNLDFQSPSQPATILADPTQLEQVLVNLVVNARDAMPDGGDVKIEIERLALDEPVSARFGEIAAGNHIVLRVTDNGVGMDEATQARIFEPFFTTKGGSGTGLGLATVFGIAQQCGASIRVTSKVGLGTSFEVLFPATAMPVINTRRLDVAVVRGRGELILLVEDEHAVRRSASAILKRGGYRVLEANNAGEALLLTEQHAGKIHLVLTDVQMPFVNGPRLAQRIRGAFADMPVLFMSGFPDDADCKKLTEAPLLQKPFSPQSLSRAVRNALDTSRPTGRSGTWPREATMTG